MVVPMFRATRVDVEDMGDFLLVGFAAASDYLMLQRAYEDDDQDRELGMDTYHVEHADQANACYGGIARLIVERDRIEVRFDAKGQTAMGGAAELCIDFAIDDDRFDAMVAGLRRIFEGTDCLDLRGAGRAISAAPRD